MKTAPLVVTGAGLLFSFIQLTPAPIDLILLSAAGGVTGGAIAQGIKHLKRDGLAFDLENRAEDPFAGLPQPAAHDCKSQLSSSTVTFSSAENNGVRLDGVPSACMTLANVFLGENPDGPAPTPMGMLILFQNFLLFLTEADMSL